jgi:hypothetical protein
MNGRELGAQAFEARLRTKDLRSDRFQGIFAYSSSLLDLSALDFDLNQAIARFLISLSQFIDLTFKLGQKRADATKRGINCGSHRLQ